MADPMETVELIRYGNAGVALAACFFWTVFGVRRHNAVAHPILNVLTVEIGALLFMLAWGSYDAAQGNNPEIRVVLFFLILTALAGTLGWIVLRSVNTGAHTTGDR